MEKKVSELEQARYIIRALVEWADCTGGWEAEIWQEAQDYLRKTTSGCGTVGPQGYRCTHHENGEHVVRGTEPGSWAESWCIEPAETPPATDSNNKEN